MPGKYLHQCWHIVNWNCRKNFIEIWIKKIEKLFIHENGLQNIVSERAAILCRGWWVKICWLCQCLLRPSCPWNKRVTTLQIIISGVHYGWKYLNSELNSTSQKQIKYHTQSQFTLLWHTNNYYVLWKCGFKHLLWMIKCQWVSASCLHLWWSITLLGVSLHLQTLQINLDVLANSQRQTAVSFESEIKWQFCITDTESASNF